MSTSSSASAIFPAPIDVVWKTLRDFSFPKHIANVSNVELLNGGSPVAIGTGIYLSILCIGYITDIF